MKQKPMGNVHVCSGFAWWFPFANTNQRWREIPWKSYISCFATNSIHMSISHRTIPRLSQIFAIPSPHIPLENLLTKWLTEGTHAFQQTYWPKDADQAQDTQDLVSYGVEFRKKTCFVRIFIWSSSIYLKNTNIYIERNTPWHGNIMVTPGGVFKCWM